MLQMFEINLWPLCSLGGLIRMLSTYAKMQTHLVLFYVICLSSFANLATKNLFYESVNSTTKPNNPINTPQISSDLSSAFPVVSLTPPSQDRKSLFRHGHRHLHSLHSTSYVLVMHSALDAALELSDHWGRRRLHFIVDTHSGLSSDLIQSYLTPDRFDSFNVITLSSKIKFVDALREMALPIRLNFLVICSAANTDEIIKSANELRLFASKHTWMIASDEFPQSLKSVAMSPDSQTTLLLPSGSAQVDGSVISHTPSIVIYDVFRSLTDSNRIQLIQFARWHFRHQLLLYEDFRSEDQPRRLRGRVLKNMAFTIKPYTMMKSENGVFSAFSGFGAEVVHALLTHMKGSIITTEVEFGWGQIVSNGSYDGLIGRFERKECEVSYTPMHLTAQRKQAVRYVGILAPCQLDIIYATPPSTIPPTTYVLPFDLEVWLVAFITSLFIIFLLGVTTVFQPTMQQSDTQITQQPDSKINQQPPASTSLKFHIMTGTFFVEALEDPTGTPARIIYATLVVAVLMIFTYYNTLLTSFLSYQQKQIPIRNLQELADKKDFFPLLLNRSSQLEIIKAAPGGEFAAIWRRASHCGRACIAVSDRDFLLMFPLRKYCFLSDSSSVLSYLDLCAYTVINTGYLKGMYYLTTAKDFPYSRMMYMALLRLHEGGVVKRFKKKYLLNSKEICSSEMVISSFGFEQTVGLFVFLGVGIFVAVVAQIFEMRIARRRLNHGQQYSAYQD